MSRTIQITTLYTAVLVANKLVHDYQNSPLGNPQFPLQVPFGE
jgi:hypothetical protein